MTVGSLVGSFWHFSVFFGIFDRPAEVTKADKTSSRRSSAYWCTVECRLHSKPKCLAKQALFPLIRQKSEIFATFPQGKALACYQMISLAF